MTGKGLNGRKFTFWRWDYVGKILISLMEKSPQSNKELTEAIGSKPFNVDTLENYGMIVRYRRGREVIFAITPVGLVAAQTVKSGYCYSSKVHGVDVEKTLEVYQRNIMFMKKQWAFRYEGRGELKQVLHIIDSVKLDEFKGIEDRIKRDEVQLRDLILSLIHI